MLCSVAVSLLSSSVLLLPLTCPPPSLSLAALKSHLCASYEPTPLLPILHFRIYIYLYGSSIETSISRRCLPFTNNSKVPLSSIDPQPCRLLSRPSSLGSSFFPFLVPSLSLSLSLHRSFGYRARALESANRKMGTSASA